jgi:hypothetical protein
VLEEHPVSGPVDVAEEETVLAIDPLEAVRLAEDARSTA